MKKFLLAAILFYVATPIFGQAAASSLYTYSFHLYFTGKQITLDPAFSKPYDVLAGSYTPTSGTAYGNIKSVVGNSLADFQYTLETGPNNVEVQYYPNAGSVTFYGSTASIQPITISVAENATCNENRVCEEKIGESADTCPQDCGNTTSTGSTILNQQQGNGQTATGLSVTWFIIIGFFLTGIIGLGIYLFIRKKNAGQ